MNEREREANLASVEKYKLVVDIISRIEGRLRLSELTFLSLNIIIFLTVVSFVSHLSNKAEYFFTYFDLGLVFLCIIVGMSIAIYWVAYAMRIQLKLKLRYFQARTIERKFNTPDENIFSDEHIFFDPDIWRLESHDKKEVITFPTRGLFSRMDSFFGSLKPRYFSWLLPHIFIVMYWVIFILVLTRV